MQTFRDLDRILRGAKANEFVESRLVVRLTPLLFFLGAIYGVAMGSFAALSGQSGAWRQMIASAIKVPALFLLTLIVTFPSLYVFNALIGSTLTLRSLGRLMTAALGVTLALLASFATIVAFFSFTTESYFFMVVLNVIAFAIAGLIGMRFLVRSAKALATEATSPVELIRIWTLVFGLVGAQMSWVLRPFIGSGAAFTLFQPRGSNFFTAMVHVVRQLFN